MFMHFKTQRNIFHCCFQEVLLVMHVIGVFFTSFDFNFEEFCNFLNVILMMHAIRQGYPDFGLNLLNIFIDEKYPFGDNPLLWIKISCWVDYFFVVGITC